MQSKLKPTIKLSSRTIDYHAKRKIYEKRWDVPKSAKRNSTRANP